MPRKRKVTISAAYHYELSKRSNWDAQHGLPGAAMAGDRDAIQDCAGLAAVLVEKMPVRAEHEGLRAWLVDALAQVHAGTPPDSAFSWKRGTRGAPPSFRALRAQYLTGKRMAELIRGEQRLTVEQAAEVVAPDRYDYAIECYQNFDEGGEFEISAP